MVQRMSSPAQRLRYLIGVDADAGEAGAITVIGYGTETLPINGVGYINCRQEKGGRRPGVMYLPEDDIEREYGEPAFVFNSLSFWENFDPQVAKWKRLGASAVEIDNLDTYTVAEALKMFDRVHAAGMGVWVKNAAIVDGDRKRLLEHAAAVGCIVERDCGTPATYEALRKDAGKPDMPIRFVAYGDGRNWAQQVAAQITAAGYPNMGVTHSPGGEYTSVDHILLPSEDKPMAWRVAKSLLKLREQVDAKWPSRDKSSDGTIGDAAHQATQSDHNPNSAGVVTAMDITHDPAHGLDARKLAEALVTSRDPRIKYIISNGEIISSVVSPWQWRPYTGSNAHRQHVHISVNGSAGLYDDDRPWNLGEPETKVPSRQYGITATFFGGSSDPNTSAYDGHLITDTEYGVALPYRFKGERPKVRVFKGDKSVVCEIVDVGPWNINDPYWETGSRPQAESGRDMQGRTTNRAGIDVTPAVNRALGLNGKGIVDWEFVGQEPVPMPQPNTLKELLAQLETERKAVIARLDGAAALIKKAQELANQPPPKADSVDIIGMIPEGLVPVMWPLIQKMSADQVLTLLRSLKGSKPGIGAGTAALAGAGGGMGFAVLALEIITKLMGG